MTTELVPSVAQLLVELEQTGSITTTSLDLPDNLAYDRYEAIGRFLGVVNDRSAWWIGDWVNFGESRYGEKYAQALNETGLEYQALADVSWVSRAVESSRRRELSFSHHREIASLSPEEQSEWLDRASSFAWSHKNLRNELRLAYPNRYGRNASGAHDKIVTTSADQQGAGWKMLHGDFRSRLLELPAGSADMICTDPPYPAEYLPLWDDLGAQAARLLRAGGVLVARCGLGA